MAELIQVSMARIKANPQNPRKVITALMIDKMAVSLKSAGLKNPLKVIALSPQADGDGPNGDYQLISGHIRLAGAQKLGWTTITALVLTLTPEEALLEAILDNRGEPMTWLETYMAAESLLNTPTKTTHQAVADQLELDKAALSRGLKLLGLLTPQARERLVENFNNLPDAYIIPEVVVRRLGDLEDPQKVEQALKVAIDQKMTEKQAAGLVEWVKGGNPADTFKAVAPHKPTVKKAKGEKGPAKTPESPVSETMTTVTPPSLEESVNLAGHSIGKGVSWLNQNGFKLIGYILKWLAGALIRGLQTLVKNTGKALYNVARFALIVVILGAMVWFAWSVTHRGINFLRPIAAWFGPKEQPAPAPETKSPETTALVMPTPQPRPARVVSRLAISKPAPAPTPVPTPSIAYQPMGAWIAQTANPIEDKKYLEAEIAALHSNVFLKNYPFTPDDTMEGPMAYRRLMDLQDPGKYTLRVGHDDQTILTVAPSSTNLTLTYKDAGIAGLVGGLLGGPSKMDFYWEDVKAIHTNLGEYTVVKDKIETPRTLYYCAFVLAGTEKPFTVQCATAGDLEHLVSALEYYLKNAPTDSTSSGRSPQDARRVPLSSLPYLNQGLKLGNDNEVVALWADSPADKAGLHCGDRVWSFTLKGNPNTPTQQQKRTDMENGLQAFTPGRHDLLMVTAADWKKAKIIADRQTGEFNPARKKITIETN